MPWLALDQAEVKTTPLMRELKEVIPALFAAMTKGLALAVPELFSSPLSSDETIRETTNKDRM